LGGAKNKAGTKMKSTSGWVNGGNGTNSSGFSAPPGGSRTRDGEFIDAEIKGYFWSSSMGRYNNTVMYRYLYYGEGSASSSDYYMTGGMSVRCLKD
jgi:uncharacterized protein (TIGR02145 family)